MGRTFYVHHISGRLQVVEICPHGMQRFWKMIENETMYFLFLKINLVHEGLSTYPPEKMAVDAVAVETKRDICSRVFVLCYTQTNGLPDSVKLAQ